MMLLLLLLLLMMELLLLLMMLLLLLLLLMMELLLLLQVLGVLVDPLGAEVGKEVVLRTASHNLLRTPSCGAGCHSCLPGLSCLYKLLQSLALLLLLDGEPLRAAWSGAVRQ